MIFLPPSELRKIEQAAENAYPAECCGLLVGHDGPGTDIVVTRAVESENLKAADRTDRFEVDPKVRFDLMRALEGTQERIVGHYHSHPDHPANPSATDLSMVWEPELIWLITAVEGGRAAETAAHRPHVDGSGFDKLELRTDTP